MNLTLIPSLIVIIKLSLKEIMRETSIMCTENLQVITNNGGKYLTELQKRQGSETGYDSGIYYNARKRREINEDKMFTGFFVLSNFLLRRRKCQQVDQNVLRCNELSLCHFWRDWFPALR